VWALKKTEETKMKTIQWAVAIGALSLMVACAGTPTKGGSSVVTSGAAALNAQQLATFVQREGMVYNMVAPIVKGYTMSDPKMTKATIMPRRAKILAWGTRLKRAGARILPVFPELNRVPRGVDTPSPKLVQQEVATYNMVAPIVKGYTMSDPKMTKATIMPRRAKILGWGQRLKKLGGAVAPVFPELR